ncbi:hypothetical protein JN531_012300 [Flagellatimonas centrodinii]|uniref:hypothetical protein n=1 Tax=Flagellatimonas centrodinii TaxID=2806210 RepID=UPI001FF06FC6|nr:hypothetical protein [Flagellatimonas centrodinii]ULQ45881.1 hypothetical protein JN531_012300 [Flagellatimonas centrodinii]
MAQSAEEIRGLRLKGATNRNMGIVDWEVVAAGNARTFNGVSPNKGPVGGFKILTDGNLVATSYAGNEATVPVTAGEWMPGTFKALSASTTCDVLVYW